MVGNAHDALIALNEYREGIGMSYIGEGCSRSAYLINGVVYKIHNLGSGGLENAEEITRANLMRPFLPKGFAIPEMTLFEINGEEILACEYIDGILTGECSDEFVGLPCTCGGICLNEQTMALIDNIIDFYDWSYGNVIDCEGVLYLIDCA